MQKQSSDSVTWPWPWAAAPSCLPWPLLEGLEGTAGDELCSQECNLHHSGLPSACRSRKTLAILKLLQLYSSPLSFYWHVMFLAFSTLIPVAPLNSLHSFRQFSYALTGKLADIPDGLCCPFPKAVLVPFPSLYSKLGVFYGVLVITDGVLLSLSYNTWHFFLCYQDDYLKNSYNARI